MAHHNATPQRTTPFELNAVHMRAHQLAPQTYAVMASDVDDTDHTATNAGFVVGDTCVLVIESLSNGRLASQLIGEIRRVTPLPIRFLVNTSYHGDHCFGNFVFPSETVIIQHEATKRMLDENFEQDRAFMIGLLGPGRGIEEVPYRPAELICTDELVVDLGGKRVKISHLGYVQTDGDLVVTVPDDNIVFVGNMVQAPPPAFPWLFDGRPHDAIATYERLFETLNDDTTVIPGHGRAMTRDEIRYSIDNLRRLSDAVAMAAGGEERAAAGLPMSEYAVYSMYERIHLGVNVPALLDATSQVGVRSHRP
jgi:cyclase